MKNEMTVYSERIAAMATIVCLMLAASLCMQKFIEKAEASSMRHGYCFAIYFK
ncbi:MAG: hypothetical protein LBD46_08590 [Endomicrobium sp.]|jgi:hypothetical protein|nr:hypothetical protein [Endomicrobium sp.]